MKIVILGGVAAGAKAAAKARRLLPDANIDLYTDDTHISTQHADYHIILKEISKTTDFYW